MNHPPKIATAGWWLAAAGLLAMSTLCCWPSSVHAYSNGAPNGEACRTLYPGHGVDKQYGRSSYRINASRRLNDSKIVVTLYSPTDTFLGFIMQARLHTDREMLVNGQFWPDEHDQNIQTLDCLGGIKNTLTHTNAYPKYKIETVWTPPKNFISDIVFRVTVVQSKNVFWTAIDSEMLEISPSPLITYNPGVNSFNIHNSDSSPHIPSGFVVSKDSGSRSNNNNHLALSSAGGAITPASPFMTVSHQPLVQNHHRLRHPDSSGGSSEMIYYLDYNVCARKLCFGLPHGCLRKRNCIMLLTGTYIPYADFTVEFEIIADHRSAQTSRRSSASPADLLTTSAYYSMAFSHDKYMGNDSVTDCVLSNGRPQILHSANTVGRSNEELSESEIHGVTVMNATYTNGILYCKWRKRRRFTLRGTRFDLRDHRYHIMMAFGRVDRFSNFHRKEPHFDKIVSDSMVDFRSVGTITAYSKLFLIKFHACFMIVAWVGFASIGIITARYLKPLWLSHSLFGVRIWFAIHRSAMLAALIFVCMGAICIFLYVDGISFGLHQILGLLAVVCAVANPIGAVFRPDCESSKRWIFNWAHWFIGNTGFMCAIGALFSAIQLTAVHLELPYLWSIAFYVFFNLTVHALLQLYFCNCHHNKDSGDISPDGSMPSSSTTNTNTSQRIDSLADNPFLRYIFILYSVVILIFVITIISFVLIY